MKKDVLSKFKVGEDVMISHSHRLFIENDIVTVLDNHKKKVDGKAAIEVKKANGIKDMAKTKYIKKIK